jgi:hypothetical protein
MLTLAITAAPMTPVMVSAQRMRRSAPCHRKHPSCRGTATTRPPRAGVIGLVRYEQPFGQEQRARGKKTEAGVLRGSPGGWSWPS